MPIHQISFHLTGKTTSCGLYDPDPATGKDKSLRAFIHTVSSGVADLDAIVTERALLAIRSITQPGKALCLDLRFQSLPRHPAFGLVTGWDLRLPGL
jgi:hypothetical protein